MREQPYAFRDYFKSAAALGEAGMRIAAPARAFQSEHRASFEFAFSAPIFGPRNELIAVLLAMVSTSSAFGSADMGDPRGHGPITAVLAPRDLARGEANRADGAPERYVMLVHPSLRRGQECELTTAVSQRLTTAFGSPGAPAARLKFWKTTPLLSNDYRDPLDKSHKRWLAAFAPVGRTGYVVLAQMRYEDATRASTDLRSYAERFGPPIVLALFACVSLVMLNARRRLP